MKWYSITNRKDEKGRVCAEIFICDEIGWNTTLTTIKNDLKEIGNFDSVRLVINSPGGDVFTAIGIYNYLKSLGVEITATVAGLAASAATIVLCAADTVEMPENSYIMTHNATSCIYGTSQDMQDAAKLLDNLENNIASIYAKKTGKTVEDMKAMMQGDHWMNAEEAKEKGFCNIVTEKQDVAALARHARILNSLPPGVVLPEEKRQENVVGVKAEDLKKIQDEMTTLQNKINTLEKEKTDWEQAVNARVTTQLAEMGISASAAPAAGENTPMTKEEFIRNYQNITDAAERSAYYNDHGSEFFGKKK